MYDPAGTTTISGHSGQSRNVDPADNDSGAPPCRRPEADRLVRWPLGPCAKLITSMDPVAVTKSCQFPVPSPKRPSEAGIPPDSSCCALSVLAAPAARISRTPPPDPGSPSSSRPVTVTVTLASVRLITRSPLHRERSFPGMNIGTWCSASLSALRRVLTTVCISARNPPVVRM